MKISSRVKGIAPSATLTISALAKKLMASGVDVIDLGVGEPDFDTPNNIKQAAKNALDAGFTKYTEIPGALALRQVICEKLKSENGLNYDPAQIVVANGAKQALLNTLQTVVDEGDEVLIPSPYWVTYPELVKLAGGVPVFVETKEDDSFSLDVQLLEQKVSDRTVAIILNNPCNPTGAVYDYKTLEGVGNLAVKHDLCIIADEIYEKLYYGSDQLVSIASISPEIYDHTVIINGVSKSYSMTGWRIGYSAAPAQISKAISGFQSHATSAPNTMAQYAAIEAMTGNQDEAAVMLEEFTKRRNYVLDRIGAIDGLSCQRPDGAFYVMLNIAGVVGMKYQGKNITDSMDFTQMLLEDIHVAVVPGQAFGLENHVRLSYATSMESLGTAFDRIEKFVSELI